MKNRDRFDDYEKLLMRESISWAPQVRWYTLMSDLGYEWTIPVRDSMKKRQQDAMNSLAEFLDKEAP
jgi:hypothetical protein